MSKTFFVTDSSLLKHRCEWDSTHIEIPERLQKINERLESSGILDCCEQLKPRFASEDEILLVHTPEYLKRIQASKGLSLVSFGVSENRT